MSDVTEKHRAAGKAAINRIGLARAFPLADPDGSLLHGEVAECIAAAIPDHSPLIEKLCKALKRMADEYECGMGHDGILCEARDTLLSAAFAVFGKETTP